MTQRAPRSRTKLPPPEPIERRSYFSLEDLRTTSRGTAVPDTAPEGTTTSGATTSGATTRPSPTGEAPSDMTVNVARRTRRRATPPATPAISSTAQRPESEPVYVPVDSIAIGEFEQTVFDCPNCRRPLALGARRCPGCRKRLVNGVVISKASLFVATGLAVGIVAGVAAGFAIGNGGSSKGVTPPVVPGASKAPVTSAPVETATTAPVSQPPVVSDIPPVTRSALVQALATNDRLAASGAELEAALAAPSFNATDVARTLRTMSADAVFGEQVATHVRDWSGTSAVGADLVDFYATIHESASAGLVASVQNASAYRTAAKTMLGLLDQVDALEAAMRSAATSAGVTLPD